MCSRTQLLAVFVCCVSSLLANCQTTGVSHPSAPRDLSPKEIAERAFPSVVLLLMSDASGQPVSLGSGFFVLPNVIATNVHVVSGASIGYAKLVGQNAKLTVKGIVGSDPGRDLVLLAVSDASAPPLTIGNSEQLAVGDSVFSVENPKGLEGTFSQGIVSGIRTVDSDQLLQITAPISPGSSGGPVMDVKGAVVGVAVATIKGGQNLNFAIPASYLKPLLARTGSPEPLSLAALASSSSITGTFDTRATEGFEGTSFMWDDEYWDQEGFSFSLKNRLQSAVKDVYLLVIFYGRNGSPVDVTELHIETDIPAGLAKRIRGVAGTGVKRLTTSGRELYYGSGPSEFSSKLYSDTKVEFRVLDFTTAEE